MTKRAATWKTAIDPSMQEIVLTKAEADNLWFIPQAPGGKQVPEEIQASLEAKGLVVMTPRGRWITQLGDKVRLGHLKVRIEG